jgi:hypothetical protein
VAGNKAAFGAFQCIAEVSAGLRTPGRGQEFHSNRLQKMMTNTGDIQASVGQADGKIRDFMATPRRRPAPMTPQDVTYWTPRAIAAAMVRGMTAGLGPHRTLRRASISAARKDE